VLPALRPTHAQFSLEILFFRLTLTVLAGFSRSERLCSEADASCARQPFATGHGRRIMMTTHILSALALSAAVLAFASGPAQATDTSSLPAFVQSCAGDAKGCHSITLNAIITARSNRYGCIPKALSDDAAADQLLDWLKNTANASPKYQKEALADLVWTGIDEIWPCHRK
jgi:hypothetical protein